MESGCDTKVNGNDFEVNAVLYFLKIDSGYSGDHCITIIYVFVYFILFCTYVLIKIKQ